MQKQKFYVVFALYDPRVEQICSMTSAVRKSKQEKVKRGCHNISYELVS